MPSLLKGVLAVFVGFVGSSLGCQSSTDDGQLMSDTFSSYQSSLADTSPIPCLNPGEPSADAYELVTGPTSSGIILPNGRSLTPWGLQVTVGVFPLNGISSPDGKTVYVSNGGDGPDQIAKIDVATGQVLRRLQLERLFFGLAVTRDGARLYAAGGESDKVFVINTSDLSLVTSFEAPGFAAGVALSSDESKLYVTENLADEVLELDTTSGATLRTVKTDRSPYQILISPDGAKAYVTQWSASLVSVLDLSKGRVATTLKTGKNPGGILLTPDNKRLLVAASDGDQLEAYSTTTWRLLATARTGSYVMGLHGVSPNSLAISADGTFLYLANAGDNALEVFEVSSLTSRGSVPVGWYPAAVAIAGSTVAVVNAKGEGAGPSPDGHQASTLMDGTVSLLPIPFTDRQLEEGAAQVLANNTRTQSLHEIDCDDKMFPIPAPGMRTPIEHVVLILRENKTYDAYFGDLEVGDGDPSLTLFGEPVTPNSHELARQFTLLDNFYTDSEDSDQGHLWTTSAFVNDFSERLNAVGRTLGTGVGQGTDSETGYLFGALLDAGVSFVNYGEVVGLEPRTMPYIDFHYPGVFFNLNVKDEEKAAYVISQIENGVMPRFTFLSLPNDHTNGTDAGRLSPESMVSDNDYGVGMVIDAISHSEYWPTTAIFVFEDDPQTGADHLEAHRSPAFVVSPWAKRAHVSSVLYSIPSVLRTIGLILGVDPLTQYDARATPMYDCFTAVPDFTPYDVMPRQIPDTYNTPLTLGADESKEMDFSWPDRAPGLGRVIWRYMKGTDLPASRGQEEEEDED